MDIRLHVPGQFKATFSYKTGGQMKNEAQLHELINKAFEQARSSKGADTFIMNYAVLKNRLIQITDKTFSESNYDINSLWEFLSKYPERYRLDGVGLKKTIEQIQPLSPALETHAKDGRIRSDLWRAIMDYSSGQNYIWDESSNRAIPNDNTKSETTFNTITKTELEEWKTQFCELMEKQLIDKDLDRLMKWKSGRTASLFLPPKIFNAWKNFQNNKVKARLEEWFSSNKIPSPVITEEKPEVSIHRENQISLKAFLHQCIDIMNEEDLKKIYIPAHIAQKALR